MRLIEEGYLHSTVAKLNTLVRELKSFAFFFNATERLHVASLQEQFLETNVNYFNEVATVLSFITSIVNRPHFETRGEEVIIRAELATSFQNDMFQRTIRDVSLWKEKGADMSPEHIYHHQSIDDIKTYENAFIVKLIDLIGNDMDKYYKFYMSTVFTFRGQENLSLSTHNSKVAIDKISTLQRKIRYIKNTFFYRHIKKANIQLKSIYPTNILLKDRLYNYCFKFYNSLFTYSDRQALLQDFKTYYYILLLKCIKKAGFTARERRLLQFVNNGVDVQDVHFDKGEFTLSFADYRKGEGLMLSVENKHLQGKPYGTAKHLLLFDPGSAFDEFAYSQLELEKESFTGIDVISIWNIANMEEGLTPIYANIVKEEEMVADWLQSKLATSTASADIYKIFCPVCRMQGPESVYEEENVRKCTHCKSQYVFLDGEADDSKIWFINLRRKVGVERERTGN